MEPFGTSSGTSDKTILSVSQFTLEVRRLLETRLGMVWVEGEISNFSRPASGHWYFSLKDAKAQVRCAMFSNRNKYLPFRPQDGMAVLLRAKVSLYEPRGDFQLIVEHMEPAGEGALRAAFEALKLKLAEAGLFAQDRKRPLPAFPQHLAVITSATGAALRDVLAVLRRRCPALQVSLLPVAVQGEQAGPQILAAFDLLKRWQQTPTLMPQLAPPDLVLLVRGGGSLEDLWSFNLEAVARAIADSALPVVCGIGHETDVTIADLVADLRAPTPSAAAELVAPDLAGWRQRLARQLQNLYAHWRYQQQHRQQRLQLLLRQLVHPGQALQQQMQQVDEWERRLGSAMLTSLQRRQQQLGGLARALHAVSPLATLDRGYALVLPPAATWGKPLDSISQIAVGAEIQVVLRDGRLQAQVQKVQEVQPPSTATDPST